MRRAGLGFDAVLERKRYHIGQVILALRIAVRKFREPAGEPLARQQHDAGVDLADAPLFLGRVFFLDDCRDPVLGIAHDAAVTVRVIEFSGQNLQALTGAGGQCTST